MFSPPPYQIIEFRESDVKEKTRDLLRTAKILIIILCLILGVRDEGEGRNLIVD